MVERRAVYQSNKSLTKSGLRLHTQNKSFNNNLNLYLLWKLQTQTQ